MSRARRYWLMKTEPSVFSWKNLAESPGGTTTWDGVRNYRARNHLRDDVQEGDGVLFYHSSCDPPEIVGLATVVREGYPDPTQLDPRSPTFDPLATAEEPRWYTVDVRVDRAFARPLPLAELRRTPGLEGMALLRKGNRLSVQPVRPEEWKLIVRLGRPEPGTPVVHKRGNR